MRLINKNIQLSASDLVNFLGCKHLTKLDLEVASGEREKPDWNQPALVILQQKGQEHEDAYLAHLKASGLSVMNLMDKPQDDLMDAMTEGYDIIIQATFKSEAWQGRADFLRKIEGKSKFGNYSYEVEDTKLSQNTKAVTLLQLCFYSEMLAEFQEFEPERMYVVKPGDDFPTESYRFQEFLAYYQLIKQKLNNYIEAKPHATYPNPCEKCNTCQWWHYCDDQRHKDDHLSLVAGLQNSHRSELEGQEINSLEKYANEPQSLKKKLVKGNKETYDKLHKQAKVQLKGRKLKTNIHELLTIVPERGLNRLPNPSVGDVYFDIEGDHFYPNGGLEYLLGMNFCSNGKLLFVGYWARNRVEEKKAFIKWIDFIMKRWEQYPDFYIYHYAPYEPAAIKRLASRHAIHEIEVDQLLRAERFIDLYSIIKESLQASVEHYTLKDLEKFTPYLREIELRDASAARRRVGTALELNAIDQIPDEDIELVERYNEDDCRATEAIHKWLEEIREEQVQLGQVLTRPELKSGDPTIGIDERDEYAQQLYSRLVEGMPDDIEDRSTDDQARWLLAHMVDYFRRENRTAWWEFFRLHELEDEELLDERHGIAYLEFESEYKKGKERVPTHRYKFPPQEISTSFNGSDVTEVQGDKIGSVRDISTEEGWVDIKKTGASKDVHPSSVHTGDPIRNGLLANSLHVFAESVIALGIHDRDLLAAGRDLLLRNPPKIQGNEDLYIDGEKISDAAIRIALKLDNSILPIQGPPGTGKTYIGALMIVALVEQGKRVGVTAVGHTVIRNLLKRSLELGSKEKVNIQVVHKISSESEDLPDGLEEVSSNPEAFDRLSKGKVVGGTSWLWAREEAEGTLDYLFVDEAGQMSLANVLSCSRAANNIVLLGDPQQLEQPQKGAHPEGADVSALNHLLNGKQTMPEEKGLFLGTTWRLPDAISQFTSEQFYESRLESKTELKNQKISGDGEFVGNGLFYVPVQHEGNQNKSLEEVEMINLLVNQLLSSNLHWTNIENKRMPIDLQKDILIVAPYNAQVSALLNCIPGMRIGTVDKFQGEQAPIVIYSMTSSSPDDAPRGMSFLYNPNRLNVATSRAQCISILVGNPLLFEPECHSVDQMRWANALCRYREIAKEINI